MPAPQLVVMGVSGAGKSTIAALLAERLGVPYRDADDLHPASNIAAMRAGRALTDDDRWPWLALVGDALTDAGEDGLVIACSALRRAYRDAIRAHAPRARFVLLDVPREVLAERLASRQGHFMPASLLDSQLATLEPLGADERGLTVGVAEPDAVVEAVAARLLD